MSKTGDVLTGGSGHYVYRAPQPHTCDLPVAGANPGDVWRCDCGQYHKRLQEGYWSPIGDWDER